MLASWRVCLIVFPEMILPRVSFVASPRVARWMLFHFYVQIYVYINYSITTTPLNHPDLEKKQQTSHPVIK